MQEFLEYVVKGLVDHPQSVQISPVLRDGITVYQVRVHSEDMGKVIGKQGNTINAIRSLLQAGSAKQGTRSTLEVLEGNSENQEAR